MNRPMVLPLPGNSTKEQCFYDQQAQPAPPGVEWPGCADLDGPPIAQSVPEPRPFKIDGGR